MNRYNITLKFSGGDEIRATVEANRKRNALERLKETKQYRDFVAEHFGEAIVESQIDIVLHKPKDNTITITNKPNANGWYYIDHEGAGVRLEFKKGHFNDIQHAWQLHGKNQLDPLECATALREIADWVQEYFPELISAPPTVRILPKEEGADQTKEPSMHNKINCFYRMDADVAEFIKRGAKENGMSQGEFIEWMMTEDEEGGEG